MYSFYYIKTCDTSLRILKQLPIEKFQLIDIKTHPLTVNQLENLKDLVGSYEALFSRKAKKYKEMDLKSQNLSETDYRRLLLDEYTFLKRPVIIIEQEIFVGSEKKNLEKLMEKLKKI
jgi:arsenate reductase